VLGLQGLFSSRTPSPLVDHWLAEIKSPRVQQDEVDHSRTHSETRYHSMHPWTAKASHSESLKLVSCGRVLGVAVWRFFCFWREPLFR
jgi:hypothetical protein